MARGNSGFWADFRKFIMRGNVIDLAVAVIIGGAFTKIVDSLVTNIITPAILNPAIKAAGIQNLEQLTIPNTGIKYGAFLAAVLSFLIVAFCLFLIVRAFEKAQRRLFRQQEQEPDLVPPIDPAIAAQEKLTGAIERLIETIDSRRNV
jgi:large conductance mechanosensitive channel